MWCGSRSGHFTLRSGKDLYPAPGLVTLALGIIPLAGCSGDTAPRAVTVTVGEDLEFQVEVADTNDRYPSYKTPKDAKERTLSVWVSYQHQSLRKGKLKARCERLDSRVPGWERSGNGVVEVEGQALR